MIDLRVRENALKRFEGHCREYLLECAWTQTPEGKWYPPEKRMHTTANPKDAVDLPQAVQTESLETILDLMKALPWNGT
jgi:hypothetical protein